MAAVKITQDTFGTLENPVTKKCHTVQRFTLENGKGLTVEIIDYGATITSIKFPDKNGKSSDIVLGFDDISGYTGKTNSYFGATIGRVANRIAKGKFTIDGKEYQVPINNGPNSLHGGLVGFDKKIWEAKVIQNEVGIPKLVFSLLSPDGDQGYPGDLVANVTYQLTTDNQLIIEYQAATTKATPIVLTNHSYFNLAGHDKAQNKLAGHFVQINADNHTPLDANLVPTGNILPVKGTVFDLRETKNLGELLAGFPKGPNGYDDNFCLNSKTSPEVVRLAGRVHHQESGRILEVHTDQPGVQFYTANFLPDPEDAAQKDAPIMGKDGAQYWKHGAFCLETQNYPNAVNYKHFPNALLQPGSTYRHTAIYKMFTVQ